MHEMSLMRKVVDIVLDECEGKDIKSVRAVHLTIGEASDVIEEFIEDLFRYLARDTLAAEAQIIITRTPILVRCNKCGDIFPINFHEPETWECPRCHVHKDYRLFSGREFRVDWIDVEADTSAEDADAEKTSDDVDPKPAPALGAESTDKERTP